MRWAYYHEHKLKGEEEPDSLSETATKTEEEKHLIKSKKSQYQAPMNKNHALELFFAKLD